MKRKRVEPIKDKSRLNLRDWQRRISNWKRQRNSNETIYFHLNHLHEEVSECFKELRNGHKPTEVYVKNGKPEGFPIELAQVLRETLWLADVCGIDIEAAMKQDMEFQESRRAK